MILGKDYHDVNADLETVCLKLKDKTVRMVQLEITLMRCFRPMLAERMKDIYRFKEKLPADTKQFYIDTKYDGERCQLHKQGDKFRYFSRNGMDFTYDYGETADVSGKFTSFFIKSLDPSVGDVIVDGEMCAWSKERQCLVQKGEQHNIRQIREHDHR